MRLRIGGATDAQAGLLDRAEVFLRDVVSMHLNVIKTREMRCKNASHRAATYDADSYRHNTSARRQRGVRPQLRLSRSLQNVKSRRQ